MIEIIPNWHPVFVHFPIALTATALVFVSAGAVFRKNPHAAQFWTTGRWLLWLAALSALAAAVFGGIAFNSVAHDDVSHAAMLLHRKWALSTLGMLLALAAWDMWRARSGKAPWQGLPVLLVIAWLLVTSTAWHGAELVYCHGLGVMSLPDSGVNQETGQPDTNKHDHEH